MKKIIIAPDSFKQTLSAIEVCKIVSDELKKKHSDYEIESIPVADGGEGTVDCFLYSLSGKKVYCKVKSPLGNSVTAYYGILPDGSAVIEMAQASGIGIEKENNALKAGTYGTGQLILHAVKNSVKNIYIGIGGSATTDGGIGCMSALGAKFLDKNGDSVPLCGEGLSQIHKIDLSGLLPEISNCSITVLCDVNNPLHGKNGAAHIFAPQKGASKTDVELLDNGLKNLAEKAETALGKDYSLIPGAGAAGGLGFALVAFLGAGLERGIDTVLKVTSFREKAKAADLIITGEGKMDLQSLMGKVPFGISQNSEGTPVTAIVGMSEISEEESGKHGIAKIIETNPLHLPFDEIRHNAKQMLIDACEKIQA